VVVYCTSDSVDGEESLWIATGDVVRQTTVHDIMVKRLQLYHLGARPAALQYRRVVDRLGGLWTVVVNIVNLYQYLHERATWYSCRVLRVDRQPVVGLCLAVQGLFGVDHACITASHTYTPSTSDIQYTLSS